MRLYLIRHAKAGDRHAWDGPDELRPLSKRGQRQADRIASMLGHLPIERIVTSPFVRCVDTVRPLAVQRGLVAEEHECLAEGHAAGTAIRLLTGLPDHSVACSHGDVIPETIGALQQWYGLQVIGPPDWRKGALWVVERHLNTWVRARAYPPPPSDADAPPVSPLSC